MAKRCVHHWIIDSENIGRCRKCPAVRDFGKLQWRGKVLWRESALGISERTRIEIVAFSDPG